MLKKAKQAYQEENFEGALEYAMNVSPMNVQSYICAAKSASQLNQHDMALKLFHEGAQLEPELPLIWKVKLTPLFAYKLLELIVNTRECLKLLKIYAIKKHKSTHLNICWAFLKSIEVLLSTIDTIISQ